MKIAVSAGHYPAAPGAAWGERLEHELARRWQGYLITELEEYGHDVFEVPVGTLSTKIGAINAERCDVALELHFNAAPNQAGRGCETLYMPGSVEGERLARAVQAHLAAVIQPDRGVKEGWYRMDRPGHVDYPGDVDGDEVIDAFVRLTHCPAVIVEPCFIYEEAAVSRLIGQRAAAAIARGVTDYLTQP